MKHHNFEPITDGIIVRDDYVQKLPSGERKVVSVIVGTPYQTGNWWQCPGELVGIQPRFPDFPGTTALGALAATLWMTVSFLAEYVRSGAQLYPCAEVDDENAEPVSEDEIWLFWHGLCDEHDAAKPALAEDDVADLASAKAQIGKLRRALTDLQDEHADLKAQLNARAPATMESP